MEAGIEFAAILLLGFVLVCPGIADPVEDKLALLEFIGNLSLSRSLNWNANSPVCGNWIGVSCSKDESRIVAVRLPGVGLNGRIPPNTLSRLSALQTLSLRSNGLTGPFPADLGNLTALVDLHLQLNSFSGPLPSDFSVWKRLTVVDLSFNGFNGSIPSSISNLTKLTALNLSNNSLSGKIPDLELKNLKLLNLSNNHLNGAIPRSLLNFQDSSFHGNDLSPVSPYPPPLPSPIPSPGQSRSKLNQSAILGIIVAGCVLGFMISAVLLLLCYSPKKWEEVASRKMAPRSPEKAVGRRQEANDNNNNDHMEFFEGCTFAFDLEDLLRASAEVLGKGTLGTAYRAVLEDSTTVVVKRLKEVGVGKRDFEQQMELVGSLRHENVVELRAYYYSKDEKLTVYDYYSQGSVSSLLHGKRGENRIPLDWDTRVRIALGTARGIAHIHEENSGKLVHGNIKSSNIFLNEQRYGCVSDLGLTTLINPTIPPISSTAGYRAPEINDARKALQSSDVYSFGVLLFELLTGKPPIQVTGGGDQVIHLVPWVQSVVREEWTAEVFDLELLRYPNIEEEMVEMLRIAMACVAKIPEQRPKIKEVVKMIEGVRRLDTGTRPSSELKSDESSSLAQQQAGTSSLSIELTDRQ